MIGSGRAAAGVGATVHRVLSALAAAGVTADSGLVDATGEQGDATVAPLRVVVDPAAWFAAQPTPPRARSLARTVGLSLAAYGSPTMQDDAEVGRLLAAIAHPERRAAEHLRRLRCRAAHVALGCRPAAEPAPASERPLELMTFGPSSPRRLRVIARGAPWLDDLRCAHHVDDELPADEKSRAAHPLARATVLVDVAAEDDAAPDLVVLLEALECGTAVVTERLGELAEGGTQEWSVRAPAETVFAHGRELARDPPRAAALAAAACEAAAEQWPLLAMGTALAELLEGVPRTPRTPVAEQVKLSPYAPPPPRSISCRLRDEGQRPDAALRHGVQQALGRLRRFEERIERIEREDEAQDVAVLHAGSAERPPRISVLVPCFSARRTMTDTLESVRATAAEPHAPAIEVVLVDDASPQDDAAAAVAWAAAHPELPVTVLRHPSNRGLPSARNCALDRARGEFVLPLDADDLLRPCGLRKLLTALDARPDAGFAYGLLQEFDVGGPVGLRGLYPWQPERLRFGNYIPALALVRRTTIAGLGGYAVDMRHGYEDWDLWCRFAAHGVTGVWVPEIVASYRIRADSMSADLHLSHVAPLADMLERHPGLLG